MKRYNKYKDSGIAWLGQIPEHWEVRKLKYVFTERSDKGYPNEPMLCSTQKYGVIPQSLYENRVVEVNKNHEGLKLVRKGNFVISLRSFQGGIEYAHYRGIISAAYTILELNYGSNPEYMKYLLKSFPFIQLLQTCVIGIREGQNINYSLLRKNFLPLPPLPEQAAIVSYLDRKVSELDSFVSKQETQISYLKELKQATIAKAVTRGIDPSVALKDSGIPWLGQIPEHWEVRKCTRIFQRIGSGTTPSTSVQGYYADGDGVNWLQTGDLNDGVIKYTTKKITLKALRECNLKIYSVGSVVIAMYGATIGKVGLLKVETTTNQACCVLSPSLHCLPQYAFYLFNVAKPELIRLSFGGGQPNISQEVIKQMRLPLPPLPEQVAIVSYLDEKLGAIDRLIAASEAAIARVRELKQTLIADVVTGRICVQSS